MPYFMLCRNRVADFEKWKHVFDSHTGAHRTAGLQLLTLWRSVDDPDNVFVLFEVESIEKAQAFVNATEGAEAAKASGVLEGEIHFLRKSEDF